MASYESSQEDYTTTTTTTDGVSTSTTSTIEYKYAQLAVPGYTLGAAPSTATSSTAAYETNVTTGSSFLRLGSFPDVDTPSSYSGISGFADSLVLVNLVGALGSLDERYARTGVAAGEDSNTTGKYGVISENPYLDTTSTTHDSLVGFMDDTRSRPGSVSYSQKQLSGGEYRTITSTATEQLYLDNTSDEESSTAHRQTETKRLLYKGGWWDHTDGNRIVTTAGDKIEIIQGNSKLAVLGRQDPSGKAPTGMLNSIDISGGYSSSTYEWVKDGDGEGWSVYSSSSAKHTYKESRGVDVSYFTGTKKVTEIGSRSGPDEDNPDIVSKTWAKSIHAYTGSSAKPVQHTWTFSMARVRADISLVQWSTSIRVCTDNVSNALSTGYVFDFRAYPVGIEVLTAPVGSVRFVGCPVGMALKYGHEWAYKTAETSTWAKGDKIPAEKKAIAASSTSVTLSDGTVMDERSVLAVSNYVTYMTRVKSGAQSVEMAVVNDNS